MVTHEGIQILLAIVQQTPGLPLSMVIWTAEFALRDCYSPQKLLILQGSRKRRFTEHHHLARGVAGKNFTAFVMSH